jgi:hypothetical protein
VNSVAMPLWHRLQITFGAELRSITEAEDALHVDEHWRAVHFDYFSG